MELITKYGGTREVLDPRWRRCFLCGDRAYNLVYHRWTCELHIEEAVRLEESPQQEINDEGAPF